MNAESTLSTLSPFPGPTGPPISPSPAPDRMYAGPAGPHSSALHPISVTAIVPSRWQPRSTWDPESLLELAKHIRDHGLMYPVILFAKGDDGYELIAGERRTRAIVALALTDIPAWQAAHDHSLHVAIDYVAAQGWLLLDQDPAIWTALSAATILARLEDPADLSRLHQLVVADNIQRQNLTALEEAKAIFDLMAANHLSTRDVADQLGWSQSKVAQRLALLKLAPEVRKDLSNQILSSTHASSIARLPADAQPAFAQVAREMIQRQGDQAATVGQVAALAGATRRFLEPDHWLPAGDAVLLPVTRNRMRLIHHLLTRLHASGKLSERAPAILALRDIGIYSHENILGHKPASLCLNINNFVVVLHAITGDEHAFDSCWTTAAIENLWICSTCRLDTFSPPGDLDVLLPCPRWKGDGPFTTCDGWASTAEPLVIPADPALASWSRERQFDGYRPGSTDPHPFPHFDDLELWLAAARAATAGMRAQGLERTHERDTRHLRELGAYVSEQRSRFAECAHFQAHRCLACANYRIDLGSADLTHGPPLPPCLFAIEPLDDYGGQPRAPDFGLLVRQDGLMVPRCSQFRLAHVDVAPMPGFRLPDRPAVLAWIRRLAAWPNRNEHDHTLFAGLAWLPYDRSKPKDRQDLDGLVRYLSQRWDDLGDERIATLLHTCVSEVAAMVNYHNEFDLFDPTTLHTERWASITWSVLLGPVSSWQLSDYSKSWPRPWETSPLPPPLRSGGGMGWGPSSGMRA